MFVNRVLVVFVTMIFFVSNVYSQNTAPNQQWLLAKYDANGDRVISLNEVEEKRKQAFNKMDFDHDGDVSYGEYEELDKLRRSPVLKARFDKLDINQDGRLSDVEYASYIGSFERIDQNGDGNISQREITQKKERAILAADVEADVCLLWLCVRKNMW